MIRTPAQITIWFFLLLASVAALVVLGFLLVRREPGSQRARTFLVLAAFSLGLCPRPCSGPTPPTWRGSAACPSPCSPWPAPSCCGGASP
jgi:hypothetical protein